MMKILFGFAVITGIVAWSDAEYVPNMDVTIAKKDLFMSRGWGASGMPYPMFYLNRYTQTQQIQHKGMNTPRISNPKQLTLISGYLGKPDHTPFANEETTHRKTNQSRKNHTIPHLFVSYGWGPLG
ncbi:uncharacterized protein LOC132263327 [Phlebotomus argentipes]|uniref:uncharacterized protein LOC132263327 n=1 Tax=Phlebotomus argentipes TaxID=94469 RepID=UPI002892D794|nr:uncharacterized protein LOC132263327 [Phlebotomus argentipes]